MNHESKVLNYLNIYSILFLMVGVWSILHPRYYKGGILISLLVFWLINLLINTRALIHRSLMKILLGIFFLVLLCISSPFLMIFSMTDDYRALWEYRQHTSFFPEKIPKEATHIKYRACNGFGGGSTFLQFNASQEYIDHLLDTHKNEIIHTPLHHTNGIVSSQCSINKKDHTIYLLDIDEGWGGFCVNTTTKQIIFFYDY